MPFEILEMVNEMLWYDAMMCMLCIKQKCRVMKISMSCRKSKLLDNDYKQVLQGVQTKPCNDFKLLDSESNQITQVALGSGLHGVCS